MSVATQEFLSLLEAFKRGDSKASARLIPLVYEDLHRLARAHGSHQGRTMNATSLCYFRIMDPTSITTFHGPSAWMKRITSSLPSTFATWAALSVSAK